EDPAFRKPHNMSTFDNWRYVVQLTILTRIFIVCLFLTPKARSYPQWYATPVNATPPPLPRSSEQHDSQRPPLPVHIRLALHRLLRVGPDAHVHVVVCVRLAELGPRPVPDEVLDSGAVLYEEVLATGCLYQGDSKSDAYVFVRTGSPL